STSLLVRYLQVVSTEVHVPIGTRRPLNVLSHWIELDRVIKRGSWRFIVEDIKHFLVCVVSELCIQRFACLPAKFIEPGIFRSPEFLLWRITFAPDAPEPTIGIEWEGSVRPGPNPDLFVWCRECVLAILELSTDADILPHRNNCLASFGTERVVIRLGR